MEEPSSCSKLEASIRADRLDFSFVVVASFASSTVIIARSSTF